MSRLFAIKPMGHLLELNHAPLNAPDQAMQWPSQNVDVSAERIVRRWDHVVDCVLDTDESVQQIPIYRNNSGTNTVLFLTQRDLCKRETADGDTYSYLTPQFTTGTVTAVESIAGPIYRVTISGGSLLTSGIEPGDKFILDDDWDAQAEGPNGAGNPWATVSEVHSDTELYLTAAYGGTTGTGLTKTYTTRLLLTAPPTGERWCWAVVNGTFCFSHGLINVMVWSGTGLASELNGTYAKQARHMIAYDDRLLIADIVVSGNRNPWMLKWSKIGDPSDWTDTTAGYKNFLDTQEPITGLGVVGGMLMVYKNTMYHISRKTGNSTAPFSFPQDRRGKGLYAPDALLHAEGTNYFMGLDDFYRMNGDVAEEIGASVRKKFFEICSDTELKKVFGMANLRFNQVAWTVTDTDDHQWTFVYNYKEKSWSVYTFAKVITGYGMFAV